jgi:hypothetical protein
VIDWPNKILQNKYTRWYEQIIENALKRNLPVTRAKKKTYANLGYTEVHHIIPRSFGGSDDPGNLIRFTAREHFICHWLLTKMTAGDDRNKMLTAFVLMTGKGSTSARYNFKITSSRLFEQIRMDYADYVSKKLTGREVSQETRKKISIANTGKTHTEEYKQHMSLLNIGKPGPVHTAEVREKIGRRSRGKTYEELYGAEYAEILKEKCKHVGEKNGFYGKTHSEETRLKFKEYFNKPETKKRKSELVKGDKNPAKRTEVRKKISLAQRERMARQKLEGTGSFSLETRKKHSENNTGSGNGNAKTIKFIDPDGNEYIVKGGMRKFCIEHKLDYGLMIEVGKGRRQAHKGWRCEYLGNKNA